MRLDKPKPSRGGRSVINQKTHKMNKQQELIKSIHRMLGVINPTYDRLEVERRLNGLGIEQLQREHDSMLPLWEKNVINK